MANVAVLRVIAFVNALRNRLNAQDNLADFLLWWGGSLEYWIHINATTIGQRTGTAARSEVPYRTRSRPKGAPSADGVWTKWADGAVVLDGGLGLLLEAKCAPNRRGVGKPLYDLGRYDLPALAGIDLADTWTYWHPDVRVVDNDWISYTDPNWRLIREDMTELWGLAILLVHGPTLHHNLDDLVERKIAGGITSGHP